MIHLDILSVVKRLKKMFDVNDFRMLEPEGINGLIIGDTEDVNGFRLRDPVDINGSILY